MNPTHKLAHLISAVAALSLAACSTSPVRLTNSPEVPAAKGTIETEATDNENTRLDVVVKHLAPAEEVQQGATTYVLWTQPHVGGIPTNQGALKIDENLNGRISTITPRENFRVFITAEPSATSNFPRGRSLMWADVNEG